MQDNQETIGTRLIRLLFLLALCLPCSIHSADAHGFIARQDTIPDGNGSGGGGLIGTTSSDGKIPIKLDSIEPIKHGDPTLPKDPDFPIILSDGKPKPPYMSCSVGTPSGAFSVGGTGAAVYSLTFDATDGGGLTPQVGLAYNSQSAGYGLAGYGFNITGISAITRSGHDLFHDGRRAGVTYTSADNLLLDGKRLVPGPGTRGQDGAVYTVEGDPFTRVVVHGNDGAASMWFEVTTGSGMTYEYGNTADSKITYRNGSGRHRIASWYVNKVTDRLSNYMTYAYAVDNLCIRPTAITYGMNALKSRGTVSRISFGYRDLGANARPFAIEDRQGLVGVCLSSVTTTTGDAVFRKYTLSYDDSSDLASGKWTRLVKVEEANGRGDRFPPVTFTWQSLPSSAASSYALDVATSCKDAIDEETGKSFFAADLDGDGVSDIIRVASTRRFTPSSSGGTTCELLTKVFVSRSGLSSGGNVTYNDTPLVYELPAGLSWDVFKSMFGSPSAMDFDGDGYNDLVFPFHDSVSGRWNNVSFYVIFGSDVAAGRSSVHVQRFTVGLQSADKAPLFVPLDADGDGKDDVVCIEQRKKDGHYPCTIVRFTGGTTGTELGRTDMKLTLPQGVDKDIEKAFTGDYNNDGLPDLLLLYDGGYKIYFNCGGKAASETFDEGNTKSGTGLGNRWRMQQGDFDGDGLTDFVYSKSRESWLWIARNNGDGTFTVTKAADIGMADGKAKKDDGRFSIVAYDIDHDGRTDVVACKAGYSSKTYTNTQIKWLYSTGSGQEQACSFTKKREDDADESSIFLGDFDGDGHLELANYGSRLNSANTSFDGRINVYRAGYGLPQTGKITSVCDGMGNNTSIQYASLADPAVYSRSIKSAYPVNTYTLPLAVVEEVTADNGSVGSQTTHYSYKDLRLHIAGKGLLGFGTVASWSRLGTGEKRSITRWDGELWIPAEVKTVNRVGSDSCTTVSCYSVSKSGGNYFAYVSKKEVTDLDGNTAVTATNYDTEKGVVTDETVQNSGGMYKKAAYSGYQRKGGAWVPTALAMTQKHSDDPAAYTSTTTYSYDDNGNVLSVTTNSGTDMALTTMSAYDVWGNVLSSVTTGLGVKAVTKHNDYDPSGRFVVRSYTSPASAVNTFTYDVWGNVLTESDATDPANVLTARHTYDGWGRKLATLQADSTLTTYRTGWTSNSDRGYYTKETTTGRPTVSVWYDKGGHEIFSETDIAARKTVSKATEYDRKGQVVRVRTKRGGLAMTQELAYDWRGRVVSDVMSSGKSVCYSYGNRSVTTTSAGRSCTKTYDAWGNVVKSTDPTGEVEYRYSSVGKPSSVKAHGSVVTMAYDAAGNRLALSDPDAGTSTCSYAADGTLLSQTDGRGYKTTNLYDDLGRLLVTRTGNSTVVNTYGTAGNGNMRLERQTMDGNSVEYTHDRFGRVVAEKRTVKDHGTYSFAYEYDGGNNLAKTTYPGGLEVSYMYDNYGYKLRTYVGDKLVYKVETDDGLVNSSSFLGKMTVTSTRDERGYECNRRIVSDIYTIGNFDEEYDGATGNLLSRTCNYGQKETFTYDDLDRLVSVKSGTAEPVEVYYEDNGNIAYKTGVGGYVYDRKARPHAVTEVENLDGSIPGDALETYFNEFGKIWIIEDTGRKLRQDFCYGPDHERWSSVLSQNEKDIRTTVYAGDYEKIVEGGTTREFYYLDGNTIIIREGGETKCYLAFTDNLGSILSVFEERGHCVFNASYDAWGRQTVTRNAIGLHRGYTGHEMLAEYGIINMNGRLYDPVLGRFLSPDNYVQVPDNSQSFNRYSYCLNNPLKYTDPSGELWNLIIGAAVGGIFNWASHGFQFNAKGLGYFFTGTVAGTVGAGMASGVNVAMAGGNFLTGAAGLAQGVSSTVFFAGAASGACAGFAGGFVSGAGNSWVEGSSFGNGLLAGLNSGLGGATEGGLIGGVSGGLDALDKGTNFWTGTAKFDLNGAYSCANCLFPDFKLGENTITGKYVGQFEGINVFETNKFGSIISPASDGLLHYRAVTIPLRGIIAADGVFTSGLKIGKAMMQHEFGHILQFCQKGPAAYWYVIAPESLRSATINPALHYKFWTETWANFLSKGYFGNKWIGGYDYPIKDISFFNLIKIKIAQKQDLIKIW